MNSSEHAGMSSTRAIRSKRGTVSVLFPCSNRWYQVTEMLRSNAMFSCVYPRFFRALRMLSRTASASSSMDFSFSIIMIFLIVVCKKCFVFPSSK